MLETDPMCGKVNKKLLYFDVLSIIILGLQFNKSLSFFSPSDFAKPMLIFDINSKFPDLKYTDHF